MGERFESIKAGLEDAIAYASGDKDHGRPWVHYSSDDIRRIREKLGFSQAEFAAKLHIALGTVRNWEQGLRTPSSAALVLLRVCDKEPRAVLRAIA